MHYQSKQKIYLSNKPQKVKRWLLILFGIGIVSLLMPWTQNIKGKGKITTLYQQQKPQKLNSPIPGKIAKWFVKNGDVVKQGDTILQLSEIKDDYWDPLLVQRAEQQVAAKKGVNENYTLKIKTNQSQLQALEAGKNYKINQLKIKQNQLNNKLIGEEAELNAIVNEVKLLEDQYNRQKKMYDDGLVSLTQLQQRTTSYQNILAKKTIVENKIAQTKQEILSITVEQNGVIQDYNEKISKASGDVFQSKGYIELNKGDIAKLENQVANYKVRQGMYYILASQDGQIVQLNKAGYQEVIKEGEDIGTIVPTDVKYAIEFSIAPMDLPLVKEKQKVMCIIDGYPAIVFSGWPASSFGIFRGEVIAVENNIDANGYFTALIVPDETYKLWPKQIKMGTGVQGIAMLKNVPIYYELWRQINGFPPDYYVQKNSKDVKEQK